MEKIFKYFTILIIISLTTIVTACEHHVTSINSEVSNKEVKVEVTKPQLNEYTEPFTLSGSIKARQSAILSSKVQGHIVDISVEEGSKVKIGEVLAKIDDSETKLMLASAKADGFAFQAAQEEVTAQFDELKNRIQMLFHEQEKLLAESELAQAYYDRIAKLHEKEVATQQELDEAKSKLDATNATVAKSQAEYNLLMAQKAQLEAKAKQISARVEQSNVKVADAMVKDMYTQVISPLNGFVVTKKASIGDIVAPGQPILIVENPADLYLEVNVEESQALVFKPGTQLEVFIDAYNKSIVGQVNTVVPSSDPDSHTMKVKIDLPAHELIYSGMYARIVIPMSGKNYFIPRTAVVKKGQVLGVFVVDDKNIARFRIIKSGQTIQGFVEIISGLNNKDKVIVNNLENVEDGTKVVVLGEK